MVQVNYKAILWFAVSITILIFAMFLYPWNLSSISISDIWRALGKTVSVASILLFIFSKFLWRFKVFKIIVPIPYLGGEWNGILTYEWGGQEHTKEISLLVKQSLFYIHLKIETDESISLSYSASFNINEQRQERELIYSYSNEPSIHNRSKSPIHYGAARLSISDDNKELSGYYWTDRKTVGDLHFIRK